MMTDDEIEAEIQTKNLTGPRVTIKAINDAIELEAYHRIAGTTVTVCVLKLKNEFVVIGHSACVSSESFDKELGRKIARQHAIDQCWSLFGFHLASIQNGWTLK
jgi:hypothetical protein